VILVFVRKYNAFDGPYILAQHLLAEIRTRINDHVSIVVGNHNRRSKPSVAFV
jgi:hypothetical protein